MVIRTPTALAVGLLFLMKTVPFQEYLTFYFLISQKTEEYNHIQKIKFEEMVIYLFTKLNYSLQSLKYLILYIV